MGTDHAELVCFEPIDGEEVSNTFLDEQAKDFGYNWNEQWEPSCGEEDSDYEDVGEYYEACGWWREEYEPAKHNGVIDSGDEGYEED